MRYYKIILDGAVVGVGTTFLRWQPRTQSFMYCDFENAQLVQDVLSETLYHPDWLRRPPDGVTGYTDSEVTLIQAAEYDELYELLSGGEEIPVPPEPEPEPEPQPEPEPEPADRPMTVQEMREMIAALSAMVLNEAVPFTAQKTYYAGEVITDGARVYVANQVIIQGETVRPGINCHETSIANMINAIQAQQEE